MNLVYRHVLQAKKMLGQLDAWLERGIAHAQAKSFDPSVLLVARLAPDQYPLIRQVQSSCDQAKYLAARLSGKEPPKHPDTEQTMEQARARIRACTSYLDTFQASDFEGAEARAVTLPWLEGKTIRGGDFLVEVGLPNLYFHLTTAYAILRHNGVNLGKADFLGALTLQEARR